MKSGFMAVDALPKSLFITKRNNQLNEKAYQRALAQQTAQSNRDSSLYFEPKFQLCVNGSPEHMLKEKVSRERVLKMQHQLNVRSPEHADLAMS